MPSSIRTPILKRTPNNWSELEKLREIFLKAENDLIAEITRQRSRGNIDYHIESSLDRVQKILQSMVDEAWEYVPRMIEKQFYVHHPEARKIPEPVEKHRAGYENAQALTLEQTAIVERLTVNLLGELMEASATAKRNMEDALLGRLENDVFRSTGLAHVAAMQAEGAGAYQTAQKMIRDLRAQGVTCFVDKAGRKWSLYTYCNMVCRTTSRQAEVISLLTQDPEWDLYKLVPHSGSCQLCAALQGRVYSKHGTDPKFPSIASAFGKINPSGPNDLSNVYWIPHPNCRCSWVKWTPMGRSEEELKKIQEKSSFQKNPPSKDPRTEKQIEAYRKKEAGRRQFLKDISQFKDMKSVLGRRMTGNPTEFVRHKIADDEKYRQWVELYRKELGK